MATTHINLQKIIAGNKGHVFSDHDDQVKLSILRQWTIAFWKAEK